MTDHYHLLIELPEGILSVGTRRLNGTQSTGIRVASTS